MVRRRSARGFTLIELMLVVLIIGVLTTFAIPQFTRASARAQRSEMQTVLEKMRVYFINAYRTNGRFPVPVSAPPGTFTSEQNPAGLPGRNIEWNTAASGWQEYTFAPAGGLRMRYIYTTDGTTLTLKATGQFPGFDVPYNYTEVYTGDQLATTTEVPPF